MHSIRDRNTERLSIWSGLKQSLEASSRLSMLFWLLQPAMPPHWRRVRELTGMAAKPRVGPVGLLAGRGFKLLTATGSDVHRG